MVIKEKVHLREIAYARSGDKGAHANIGVIAYNEEGFQFLREHLTTERVQEFFQSLGVKETIRYELPNLLAFNFLLRGALGEGGSCSLRSDAQGKALGQALLEMEVCVTENILCHARKG